jgi:hypothetical protein
MFSPQARRSCGGYISVVSMRSAIVASNAACFRDQANLRHHPAFRAETGPIELAPCRNHSSSSCPPTDDSAAAHRRYGRISSLIS